MKKIAFVIQRFGKEIVGGSEMLCRMYAEKLLPSYHIDILTTTAFDYITWTPHYPLGESIESGLRVIRFNHQKKNESEFSEISSTLAQEVEFLKRKPYSSKKKLQEKWIIAQGPNCPDLYLFLKHNELQYEAIFFFTYLFPTTYFSISQSKHKNKIFVPTAHNEWPFYLEIYREIFEKSNIILYNTHEEKELVEKRFKKVFPSLVLGCGIDIIETLEETDFRKKYSIEGCYALYLGRIDSNKGCNELFEYFLKFLKRSHFSLQLILCGSKAIKIPEHPNIRYIGFISEDEKRQAIQNSEFLINPSKQESLSIVALEALALGKPILVNEDSYVLKGHCSRSNAGLWYSNEYEFLECIHFYLNNAGIVSEMGDNGKRYVKEKYNWELITTSLLNCIEKDN